jgi:hypothetical protein
MNPSLEAYPKVIPAGREARVDVRGLDASTAFAAGATYAARFFSKVNRTEDSTFEATADASGVLHLALGFASAGEYALDLSRRGEEKVLATEVFFALDPALAALRPYKGDVHLHTVGSDGRRSAAAMALAAREAGLDFIAITDHDKYEPSLEAAEASARLGLDLVAMPGEEVTILEAGGHVLSLNASRGVGPLRQGPAADVERARIVRDELAGRALAPPLTAARYAHAVWTVRKVREFGGAAVLAHPYWEGTARKLYPPPAVVEQLLADGLCDGLELVGGSPTVEGNRLAIARHVEEAHRGRLLPVVGGSDAHGDEDLGAYWTVVFARERTAKGIVGAIRDLKSVACDRKTGRQVAIYGPFALVQYAYFLDREYYPLHDPICRAQAALARRIFLDASADHRAALAALAADLAALERRFWHES